jgi:hypothetical protein
MGINISACCKEDELHHMSQVSSRGGRRLSMVAEAQINAMLQAFANDVEFQKNLNNPLVQEAFAHWEGKTDATETRQTAIKKDKSVSTVYPKLRMLEEICNREQIRVPLDHVRLMKTKLDPDFHLTADQ